jgi:hypothetical protein
MRYFTREQNDAFNDSVDRDAAAWASLNEEIRRCDREYREQLERLESRISHTAWKFFDKVILHDGTLLAMHVGDDVDKHFPKLRTKIVNKRRLSVRLEVLNYEETRLYTLNYSRVRRVVFDYPSADPWYTSGAGCSPIDDWFADELTAVDEQFLRHEVLFSSGATIGIEFRKFSVKAVRIKGRRGLPYLAKRDRRVRGSRK